MKAYALIAALALAVPAESHAGKKRVIVVGGSHCGPSVSYYRGYSGHSHCYPTYSRSYSYARPVYAPYYRSYYAPAVSFAYTSAPRPVYRPSESYYEDSRSSMEMDVQRELRRRGYYSGAVDGDIGPASREAIRAYQYDRGLRATGRIDSALLDSLGV